MHQNSKQSHPHRKNAAAMLLGTLAAIDEKRIADALGSKSPSSSSSSPLSQATGSNSRLSPEKESSSVSN